MLGDWTHSLCTLGKCFTELHSSLQILLYFVGFVHLSIKYDNKYWFRIVRIQGDDQALHRSQNLDRINIWWRLSAYYCRWGAFSSAWRTVYSVSRRGWILAFWTEFCLLLGRVGSTRVGDVQTPPSGWNLPLQPQLLVRLPGYFHTLRVLFPVHSLRRPETMEIERKWNLQLIQQNLVIHYTSLWGTCVGCLRRYHCLRQPGVTLPIWGYLAISEDIFGCRNLKRHDAWCLEYPDHAWSRAIVRVFHGHSGYQVKPWKCCHVNFQYCVYPSHIRGGC